MGDDLSAFFAKKKDKKKKVAVKVEDVGQILERKVRRQEENEDSGDEEKRVVVDDHRRASEDSDWIEIGDSNQGRLEGLKIRDLTNDIDILEDDVEDGDEEKEQQETAKTWGQIDKKEDHDVETDAAMAAYQRPTPGPAKFVPSALRGRATRDIDVSNQEMFPSLADATKIEKDKKDDTKMTTGGGWIKSGSSNESKPISGAPRSWGGPSGGPPPGATKDRDSALAAVKELAALNSGANAISRPAPPPVVAEPVITPPKAGSYVPPHLRNK